MPGFLEHLEFLIGSPQDHSGDHSLDRWISCVQMFSRRNEYTPGLTPRPSLKVSEKGLNTVPLTLQED
jgi:hypothetical protein